MIEPKELEVCDGFAAGFFDADGSVSIKKNGQVSLSFYNDSRLVLEKIRKTYNLRQKVRERKKPSGLIGYYLSVGRREDVLFLSQLFLRAGCVVKEEKLKEACAITYETVKEKRELLEGWISVIEQNPDMTTTELVAMTGATREKVRKLHWTIHGRPTKAVWGKKKEKKTSKSSKCTREEIDFILVSKESRREIAKILGRSTRTVDRVRARYRGDWPLNTGPFTDKKSWHMLNLPM